MSKAVIVKIITFLKDLKIKKNSFILLDIIIIIKISINDQKPLFKTISIKGINFISLKINGWGMPQKTEAKRV
tara:strand:+ start:279 stop:497 length:219 start_codon:yes stop_codon:yes gene_type:complete